MLRFLGLENGDGVISVRNWEERNSYAFPSRLIQIMHILEPPTIARNATLGKNNALLASYMRNSDIPIPYSIVIPINTTASDIHPSKLTKSELISKIQSKTKMVAGIISDCDFKDRLDYITELQKYIQVDVFGKCGNTNTSYCPKDQNKKCLLNIEREYKFFLSFENSRCEDYLTEKLFGNALE